ncbi:nuclear transport factor 2 family protein [Chondromyces crocatus]|uniref:SnoaL-like domain-containing protein n=1 Tax=Chondromyces crocatus TaxID=52 RepID=A0A0K1EC76_CHOCO|nr:nuclear transport factor 2 family protein [Chondromyces crocatus]AKT38282.1 uncharacterized protein CMC5_024270 [Chondromyces crocatus]
MGRNAEITRNFYNAYNRRDWEALSALLSPAVEWFHAARGELIRGREAVTALLRSSAEAFPGAQVELTSVHEAGATVVSEWIYVGETEKTAAPTAMACDVKQLRQGKLIRGATYGDTLQMLLELPSPATSPEPSRDAAPQSQAPLSAIIPAAPRAPSIRFRAA